MKASRQTVAKSSHGNGTEHCFFHLEGRSGSPLREGQNWDNVRQPARGGKIPLIDALFKQRRKNHMNEVTDLLTKPDASMGQPSAPPNFGFRRIVVPTDFSPRSENAVNYAVELAQRLGAHLTLLHVNPQLSALEYTTEGIPIRNEEEAREQAYKELAEEVARLKPLHPDVDALLRTALFHREEILNVAKELPADLLVLSTHGYTGWKHLLFGSDAEKILERAPCPILIVR
jgi:universal stress protein A